MSGNGETYDQKLLLSRKTVLFLVKARVIEASIERS